MKNFTSHGHLGVTGHPGSAGLWALGVEWGGTSWPGSQGPGDTEDWCWLKTNIVVSEGRPTDLGFIVFSCEAPGFQSEG